MIEFLHNYGLWIVLAGVFFAMHRFGAGCCGAGHHRILPRADKALPGETARDEKTSETASRPTRNCH